MKIACGVLAGLISLSLAHASDLKLFGKSLTLDGNASAIYVKPSAQYKDKALSGLAEAYNPDLEKMAQQLKSVRFVNTEQKEKEEVYRPRSLSFRSIMGGRYLCLAGESQDIYYGWKSDRKFRATDIFSGVVQQLLIPRLATIGKSATNLTGYMFTVFTEVYPYQQEFKDEFMSDRMSKFGADPVKATREKERYDFYVRFDDAQDYLGGKTSKETLLLTSVAACNGKELIWGSPSGSLVDDDAGASQSSAPKQYTSVPFAKLESPAFLNDYNGKSVSFRTMFIGEWGNADAYRLTGAPIAGKVMISTRDETYEASSTRFGSTDSQMPGVLILIDKAKSDIVYELKRGEIIEVKGLAQKHQGPNGVLKGLHVIVDEITRVPKQQ